MCLLRVLNIYRGKNIIRTQQQQQHQVVGNIYLFIENFVSFYIHSVFHLRALLQAIYLSYPFLDFASLMWDQHNLICVYQGTPPIIETIRIHVLLHPYICIKKKGCKSKICNCLCKLRFPCINGTIHPIQVYDNNNSKYIPGSKFRSRTEPHLLLTWCMPCMQVLITSTPFSAERRGDTRTLSLETTEVYVALAGGSVWFPPSTKRAFLVKHIFTYNIMWHIIYWYPTSAHLPSSLKSNATCTIFISLLMNFLQ